MHRRALALVLLAVASGAGAEGPRLAVRPAGPVVIEAVNRQTISLALVYESFAAADRTVALVPRLPEGWKAVGLPGAVTLSPGAADVRLVSFLVPAEAPAGEYLLGFELRDTADPAVAATCAVNVVVLPAVAFELSLLEAPAFVLAGEEYESVFILENTGNVDVSVDLAVECGQALPCRIVGLADGRDVAVPRGSRRELRVAVSTQAGISHSARHPVRVVARLHGQEEGGAVPPASAASIVEVIPLSLGTVSLMHTIPLTFVTSAGMAFSPEFAGFLEESINASGTLDEAGEHRVDLAIRKRFATDEDPWFNPSDRYSLWYEHLAVELMLGDGATTLSPLLAMDEYGRGASALVRVYPFRFDAVFYQDVWSAGGDGGLGGNVDFTVSRTRSWVDFVYRVALGALWPFTDHTIVGLWQQYRPLANLGFQLDAAVDIGAGGSLNPALFALATGELFDVSWNVRLIRAWPEFTGEHADTQSVTANARALLLDDNLALDAAFSLTDENLLPDISRPAERIISASLGATGDIPPWDGEASFGYGITRDVDRLPMPDFMRWEHRINLGWQQWFLPFTAGAASTLSWSIDDLTGTLLTSQKHLLTLAYDRSKDEQYDVALSWGRERTDRLMPNDSIGMNARALIRFGSTKVQAAVGTTWAYARTGISSIRFGLEGGLSQTFPWGHTLAAKGMASIAYEALTWSPEGSFSISYSSPVDIPVSRKKNVSVIRGTVVRAETGEAQKGIVLRLNGLASATDTDGRFTFYVPRSGRLYLQMDGRTLAPGLIPAQPMPRELTVEPGSETTVDLAVVAGCSVAGAVTVYGYPRGSEMVAGTGAESGATPQPERIGGLGSLVVELSNGNERMRRVTGNDGRFVFDEVRPGSWTLAVVAGTLPTYHSLEQSTVPLELAPGERREIELKVIQALRRIIIVDAGLSVVMESPSGSAGEFTVTSNGQIAPAEGTGEPLPIIEQAPVEPAQAEPAPVEPAHVALEQPEQPVIEPTPEIAVAPELPAEPALAASAPAALPPRTVPPAAPAEFDELGPTWDEIVEAWRSLPIAQGQLPAPEFAVPDAVAPAVAATPEVPPVPAVAPAAAPAVPPAPVVQPAPTVPPAPVPSPVPAAPAPVVPPAVPAPSPTPAPITIPIPLPMPTPRPPVTVPVPSPTPQPFPP